MNSVKTINKLIGHSSNLLTFYLGTVRKYKLLEPMIFSQGVCEKYGSGNASEGFKIIRSSLYYSVIQDLANIVFDDGQTNPSVSNIVNKLEHDIIANELRKKYTSEYCPNEEFRELYNRREHERGEEFDTHLRNLLTEIKALYKNQLFSAAKSVRDEFTAHLDLQYLDGKYVYPDIEKYGLKWGSPKAMLELLKPIIEKIGFIVRDASFAWDSFEAQNEKIASSYWAI